MRILAWNLLPLGVTCCLFGMLTATTSAQEPAPAPPADEPAAQQQALEPQPLQQHGGYIVTGAPCQQCNTDSCRLRYRPDYRRCYCRREPFSRHDQRDTQVFAAPGYGVPMTVPLAPVVCKQWNYGWGLPSARITHVPMGYPAYRTQTRKGAAGRPMIYWIVDTAQHGAYYMRTPW